MAIKLGQRRDYFVKKWFQSRIIFSYLFILLAGGGALALVIYKRARAALRFCLFQGHSTDCSTWEILRKQVVDTNVTATVFIIALALAAVLLISWSVARASRAVRKNVLATIAGQDPSLWTPPPRPREFRTLQRKLAAGLAGHRDQVDELRRSCSALRDRIRAAREDLDRESPGLSPGRQRELHASFESLKNIYRNFKIG